MKLNSLAPDFTLFDQNNQAQALADWRGRFVLLYFYPKDDTPGCTTEACSLRDNFNEFEKLGVVVVGISSDSVASHKKFADKYQLPFILLADTEKQAIKLYGAE